MLRARLLGALEVELNGIGISASPSQRPWALFAYVALASRPVPRAELANRFWPDVLDQSARASVRSALWALRRQLGDALVVDGERVWLEDAQGIWIDVHEFLRLADTDPDAALALCRGELLAGIEEDWVLSARERHRERVIGLLEGLARGAEQRGEVREAIELTRQQVERDPFDEGAHRRLITRLDASGDRAAAMRSYRMLTERLNRELGVAPSRQTRELLAQLRARTPPRPAERGRTPVIPRPLPLLGRERELAELRGAWHDVTRGSGAAAVIRGEAGIGKTRLASELRERASAAGAQTAACAALDLGGAAPLSLWAELIRELLPSVPAPPADAVWPDDLSALAVELPAHFTRGAAAHTIVAPDLQRTRLFEAVVALLGWAARHAPLLLVLEDVHTADVPSLELAGYAARRITDLPVMMVITRRELPHSAAADTLEHALRARGILRYEVDLEPLAQAPVAALARHVARLTDKDVRRVVELAEGNALLAVETARAIGRGVGEVAPSLRGSVRTLLTPLSGDARKLIEIAAVAGRSVQSPELAHFPLRDPDEAAVEALQSGMLLVVDGVVGFRHALLRDAVYEEIAEPRRRSLHQSWAHALVVGEEADGIPRPAEAARHFRLAGADPEAVPLLIRAAADARALAALEQAVGYLEEALTIAPARADLWLEIGELEAWRIRRNAAELAFERAMRLLEGAEPLERARAWLRRARAYHGPICVPRAVLESARNAIELLTLSDQPARAERSEALAAWAWAEAVAGSVEEAERLLVELSADETAGDLLRTYDAGHARALALMRRGRFVESYGPSIAAGDAIASAGRPDLAYGCWANAASAATAAGEHERALEFLDRGAAAIAGHGLQSLEIHLLAEKAFVFSSAGQHGQARAVAEAERALAEQFAEPELLAMASHDCGLVVLEAGDHALAATLLAASLVEGAPISRPQTRLALAEALARGGQLERASEEVRATVLEPVRAGDFPEALVPKLARVQGLIALANGELAEAERRLEESIAGWARLLDRAVRADSITTVLADLGRPVVGLVEPERELERTRAELQLIKQGELNAVLS